MTPQCLTVLAPIQPGQEDRLRDVLRAIGDDITGKRMAVTPARPHIDFLRSRHIHFARFAILNDPDRGPGRVRLLFASAYDGTLDAHLDELVAITSDMDAIWTACETYSGLAGFPAFVRAHAHEADAFYIAFRDQTAESIKSAIALRQRLQDEQDCDQTRPAIGSRRATGPGSVGILPWLIRAAPIVVDLVRALARFGVRNVYFATRQITASLDRYLAFRLSTGLRSTAWHRCNRPTAAWPSMIAP